MKKRVLIADADEQFRNELVTALGDSDEFEVIGVATDDEEALQMLQTKQADILVMDWLLPKFDGLTVLEHLRSMWKRPKVLITSVFISKYVAVSAVRLGVQQLLHKPCSVDVIIRNLYRMMEDKNYGPAVFLWNEEKTVKSLVTNTSRNWHAGTYKRLSVCA